MGNAYWAAVNAGDKFQCGFKDWGAIRKRAEDRALQCEEKFLWNLLSQAPTSNTSQLWISELDGEMKLDLLKSLKDCLPGFAGHFANKPAVVSILQRLGLNPDGNVIPVEAN